MNNPHRHCLLSFLILLACLLLQPLTSSAAGVEIWITPDGPLGEGTGIATNPYHTPDADSFFKLIHGMDDSGRGGLPVVTIPTYSTIHLLPGTFRVRAGVNEYGKDRFPLTL